MSITTSRVAQLVADADSARDRHAWAHAKQLYEKALELAPTLAPIWVQLGHARKEAGDRAGGEAAYLQALKCSPTMEDAWIELTSLGWSRIRLLAAIGHQEPLEAPPTPTTHVYDVTDLVTHFQHNRAPTGIQRVQINIVRAALTRDPSASIACFNTSAEGWIHIPRALFESIVRLSMSGASIAEPACQALIATLRYQVRFGGLVRFGSAALLVNLGSSWASVGYMAAVTVLKRDRGLIYIPFIHDLIPVNLPETCAPGLPASFRTWLDDALEQSAAFLVSSKTVAIDLQRYAGTRSITILPPLRLNGPFPVPGQRARPTLRPYVLMVATLEHRKNHLLVFEAWSRLLAERGLTGTPLLLCVGRDGPGAEKIREALRLRPQLATCITLAGTLSDEQLASSYAGSLFVICPSLYEGWGLPVTEGLSFGKLILAAHAGALPEVGGTLVSYFDPHDVTDMMRTITRWLDRPLARLWREVRVRVSYQSRPWLIIADDLLTSLKSIRHSCLPN